MRVETKGRLVRTKRDRFIPEFDVVEGGLGNSKHVADEWDRLRRQRRLARVMATERRAPACNKVNQSCDTEDDDDGVGIAQLWNGHVGESGVVMPSKVENLRWRISKL